MKNRPQPGTRVRAVVFGGTLEGEVMPYEMRWAGCSFPVKFSNGIWRMMLPDDVEEIPPVVPDRPAS